MSESLETTDKLSVYDGMSVSWKPAPLGRRLLALIADLAILQFLIGAVSTALILGATFLLGSASVLFRNVAAEMLRQYAWAGILLALLAMLAVFCLFDGYFIYTEWKWGATPGKRLLGLKVVSTSSGRMTLGQVALRDIMRWVDLGLMLPGLLSVCLTARKQRLGDLVAGTVVTHSRQEEEKQNYFYVTQELYQWFTETCTPTAPAIADCETFLKFAYPAFVLNLGGSPDDISRWQLFAVARVERLATLETDTPTKLRLFAELCFQTVNVNQGRKS